MRLRKNYFGSVFEIIMLMHTRGNVENIRGSSSERRGSLIGYTLINIPLARLE